MLAMLLTVLVLAASLQLPVVVEAATRRTCTTGSAAYWYDADNAICNTQLGPLCVAQQVARTQGSFFFPATAASECLVNNAASNNFYCVPPNLNEPIITSDRINLPAAAAVAAGLTRAFTINQWSTASPTNTLARSIKIGGGLPFFLAGNTVRLWLCDSDSFWRLKDFKVQSSSFQGNTNLIVGDLLDSTYQNPAAVFADPSVYDQSSLAFLSSVTPIPLPLTVTNRTCDDNCKRRDPGLRCNTASSKCECSPPLLPVFDGDTNQVYACKSGEWVQYSKSFPLSSLNADSGLPRGDYCMVDSKGSGFAWCQQYASINVGRTMCLNGGWHLQYRSPASVVTTDPVVFDFDCACSSRFSGKYCQFSSCRRDSLTQQCLNPDTQVNSYVLPNQPEFGVCDVYMYEGRRQQGYSSYCAISSLFTQRGQITIFENKAVVIAGSTYIIQVPQHYNADDSQLQASSPRWLPPVCELDANVWPNINSKVPTTERATDEYAVNGVGDIICEMSVPPVRNPTGPVASYTRARIIITASTGFSRADAARSTNNCADFTSATSYGSRQNTSTAPCPYGTDPRINPRHIDEVQDASKELISFPLNANELGLSRFFIFGIGYTYGVEDIALRGLQCSDPNTFAYYTPNSASTSAYCRACSPACPSDAYCSNSCVNDGLPLAQSCITVGACRCSDPASDWVPGSNGAQGSCVKRYCPEGVFGVKCDQQCQQCIPGTHCNDNVSGDGSCVCDDPALKLNAKTNKCESQHCGTSSICSGRGTCSKDGVLEYCLCDRGYDGIRCELDRNSAAYNPPLYPGLASPQAYDECDCGVVWNAPRSVDFTAPLPSNLAPLSDQNELLALKPSPLLDGYSPGSATVGSSDQARELCYRDAYCSGFVMYSLPDYWRQTQQPAQSIAVYLARFLQTTANDPNRVNAGLGVLPAGVIIELHTINRFDAYDCSSPALQLQNWYVPRNFASVQAFCQSRLASWIRRNPGLTPPPPSVVCNAPEMYTAHWRLVGHLARVQPNPLCQLLPVVNDPSKYCSSPRCPVGQLDASSNAQPARVCSGNGYCRQLLAPATNGTGGQFACECKRFSVPQTAGSTQTLDGVTAFLGNACQFPVASFCVQPSTSTICSDNPSFCRPRLAFDGNFFAGQFQSQLSAADYVPSCKCDGSALTGTFCEQSKCGPASQACHGVSLAGGDCLRQNDGSYACQCQRGAFGQYCEIDARPCLNPQLDLKCSAQGQCRPVDSSHSEPWCECQAGAFGQYCENSDCPADVMVAGHGVCSNRLLQNCYAPYTGVRCEIDQCQAYNGSVLVNSANVPTTCQCFSLNWSARLNNATVATCWPQCPASTSGQLCSAQDDGAKHLCSQSQAGQVRSAKCLCADGYISVPHPTRIGETWCEKYCSNGRVPVGWDPANPTACECDSSTGFDILQNSPRCDHPICAHNGTFDSISGQCACYPPYLSRDRCQQLNTCGVKASVQEWTNALATSKYRCSCVLPSTNSYEQSPFDCSSSVCGLNGIENPFVAPGTSALRACVCLGKYRTECSASASVAAQQCQFCSASTCLNGGRTSTVDRNVCDCLAPFVSGLLGLCESNVCSTIGTLRVSSSEGCVCKPGFQGGRCQSSICLNSGVYNTFSNTCSCPSTSAGTTCEVLLLDYGFVVPPISTAPSSTGPQAPTSDSSWLGVGYLPHALAFFAGIWLLLQL